MDGFGTERLLARSLAHDDFPLLVEPNSDAEVMRYLSGRAAAPAEVRRELDAAIGARWCLFERDTGEFVGWIGAVPTETGEEYDIGWRLRRDAWGKGLATEAARALIDRLFEAGARRVYAQTLAVNERSRRVMERCGLRCVRTFHEHFDDPVPGTELGEVEYDLDRTEWMRRREQPYCEPAPRCDRGSSGSRRTTPP